MYVFTANLSAPYAPPRAMGEIELCSCCLTPYLTALACVALAALWLLRRAPAKVDAATAEYIERVADVPQECQVCSAARSSALHGGSALEDTGWACHTTPRRCSGAARRSPRYGAFLAG